MLTVRYLNCSCYVQKPSTINNFSALNEHGYPVHTSRMLFFITIPLVIVILLQAGCFRLQMERID